jgi:uncharacterized protein
VLVEKQFAGLVPRALPHRRDVTARAAPRFDRAHQDKMPRYKVKDYALRVGRSRTGRGVFACEDIPKGACIEEYIGKEVPEKEREKDRGKYLFWTSDERMINGNIPENRARFINHSCRPNCRAEGPNGRVFIITRRRIKAGEEITYHYGKEYYEQLIKPKGCKCVKCDPE